MKLTELGNPRRLAARDPAMAQGLLLALLTAVISGFAVFLNAYAVREFASPTVYTALRVALVGLVLVGLLALRPGRPAQELRRLALRHRLGLVLLGLLGGSVAFVLFFEGLARVTSGNAAFIHKTLFLWVAVLAVVFLRERLGWGQVAALGLLLLAQVLMGGPGALRPGSGEGLVLAATLLWAAEVVLARRLLAQVGSTLGAAARMGVGGVLLLGYLALTSRLEALGQLTPAQWGWVLLTAAVLLAYVSTWYAALKRAPATAVTCVLTLGAPITAALGALAGRGLPPAEQAMGFALLVAAVLLFTLLTLRQRAERPALAAARGGA